MTGFGFWRVWTYQSVALSVSFLLLVWGTVELVLRLLAAPTFDVVSSNRAVKQLAIELRKRGRDASVIGLLTLFLVCAVLGGGAFIFYQAETNASRAYQSESFIAAQTDVDTQRNSLWVMKLKPEEERTVVDKSEIEAKKESLDDKEKTLLQVIEKDRTSRIAEQSSVFYLTSVLSTKIGVMLLLLFLVGVLVSVFRFLLKLSVFNNSRADLLSLMPDSEMQKFENLLVLLDARDVTLGAEPRTEMQYLARVFGASARQIGEKAEVQKMGDSKTE